MSFRVVGWHYSQTHHIPGTVAHLFHLLQLTFILIVVRRKTCHGVKSICIVYVCTLGVFYGRSNTKHTCIRVVHIVQNAHNLRQQTEHTVSDRIASASAATKSKYM